LGEHLIDYDTDHAIDYDTKNSVLNWEFKHNTDITDIT
jgi:hypothetical protein